jgi:hypothetical protein
LLKDDGGKLHGKLFHVLFMFCKSGNGHNTHPKNQNSQVGGSNSKEIKRGNGKRFFTKAKSFKMKRSSKGI